MFSLKSMTKLEDLTVFHNLIPMIIYRLTNIGYFQVAQTRLGNRHQRPNIELCRDEPAHRWVHKATYFLVFNEEAKPKKTWQSDISPLFQLVRYPSCKISALWILLQNPKMFELENAESPFPLSSNIVDMATKCTNDA